MPEVGISDQLHLLGGDVLAREYLLEHPRQSVCQASGHRRGPRTFPEVQPSRDHRAAHVDREEQICLSVTRKERNPLGDDIGQGEPGFVVHVVEGHHRGEADRHGRTVVSSQRLPHRPHRSPLMGEQFENGVLDLLHIVTELELPSAGRPEGQEFGEQSHDALVHRPLPVDSRITDQKVVAPVEMLKREGERCEEDGKRCDRQTVAPLHQIPRQLDRNRRCTQRTIGLGKSIPGIGECPESLCVISPEFGMLTTLGGLVELCLRGGVLKVAVSWDGGRRVDLFRQGGPVRLRQVRRDEGHRRGIHRNVI